MLLSDFDYELPAELIAQQPLAERSASRMLAVDRSTGSFADRKFSDLPGYLQAGDLVVVNNTRVFPARLFGTLATGANVEVFLIRENGPFWEALARPGRRLKTGKTINFSPELSASVVDKSDDGTVTIEFEFAGNLFEILDRIGKTPLPPYIKRDQSATDGDRERYQTVYAAKRGAIAAPTAGLHFTPEIFDRLRARGCEVAEVTLHVGYGTFESVKAERLEDHSVSAETFEIDPAAAEKLNVAQAEKRRIVAIGTTTTRALETSAAKFGGFVAGRHTADLTIVPGYRFKAIAALLTNFHLPKSSLLVLTSTFGGHELIMEAYRHAVAERYRFYSYGDCMFIS